MSYLLDTNVCIRYLNGQSPATRLRLQQTDPANVFLCSVVKAELLFGAAKSRASQQTLSKLERFFSAFESFPFDDPAAPVYAKVRAELERQGTPIGPNDLMIASIALARKLTVVTANTREFARVDGLQWEDWEASSA